MREENRQLKSGERVLGTSYRVCSLIGIGGMGSVYEVEHEVLGRRFVFKLLHDRLLARGDLVARMQNEWRALAGLRHPNIVQVTDAGVTQEGLPFYVMERLEGKTVAELIRAERRVSVEEAITIVLDVLAGLSAAHKAHVVHRDIKPQNLFRTRDGVTKLLDFGIAKLKEKPKNVVTAAGVALGTPRYMAPEQAEGKPVDGRADIYACGLVLYEMIRGQGPFAHIKDPSEIVLAQIHEEPIRLDEVDSAVSPIVSDLVHRWLAKSPESRPLSAELARRELEAVLAGLGPVQAPSAGEITSYGAYEAETLKPEGEIAAPRETPREPEKRSRAVMPQDSESFSTVVGDETSTTETIASRPRTPEAPVAAPKKAFGPSTLALFPERGRARDAAPVPRGVEFENDEPTAALFSEQPVSVLRDGKGPSNVNLGRTPKRKLGRADVVILVAVFGLSFVAAAGIAIFGETREPLAPPTKGTVTAVHASSTLRNETERTPIPPAIQGMGASHLPEPAKLERTPEVVAPAQPGPPNPAARNPTIPRAGPANLPAAKARTESEPASPPEKSLSRRGDGELASKASAVSSSAKSKAYTKPPEPKAAGSAKSLGISSGL